MHILKTHLWLILNNDNRKVLTLLSSPAPWPSPHSISQLTGGLHVCYVSPSHFRLMMILWIYFLQLYPAFFHNGDPLAILTTTLGNKLGWDYVTIQRPHRWCLDGPGRTTLGEFLPGIIQERVTGSILTLQPLISPEPVVAIQRMAAGFMTRNSPGSLCWPICGWGDGSRSILLGKEYLQSRSFLLRSFCHLDQPWGSLGPLSVWTGTSRVAQGYPSASPKVPSSHNPSEFPW